ncbi:MAG: hypothetical protein BWX86_00460 [Verrucomicrobia bacterium ADurb.Bin122]|nr:MAG: hypothetical protein BWX86_00460 [Verrucomicrobia bacterium ADurb.Bin122]
MLRFADDLVKFALEWGGFPDDVGACDVGRVSGAARSGIDEDEVAGASFARARWKVENGAVWAGADDGFVAGHFCAVVEEFGFELYLDFPLGEAGTEHLVCFGESGGGGGNRLPEEAELVGVLGPACVVQSGLDDSGERGIKGDGGRRAAEADERAPLAGGKPSVELGSRAAWPWGAPLPDSFAFRDVGDEGLPSVVLRVVGEDAAGAVEAGEVVVVGVCEEWIELIAVLRERDGPAGVHQQDFVAQPEHGRDAPAAIVEVVVHTEGAVARGGGRTSWAARRFTWLVWPWGRPGRGTALF